MMLRPKIAMKKYSAGPNIREILERGGARSRRAIALKAPPNIELKVAIRSALLDSPRWVSGKPSRTVAAEAEVPGVCRRIAEKEPA